MEREKAIKILIALAVVLAAICVLSTTDPVFYTDPQTAALKALELQ